MSVTLTNIISELELLQRQAGKKFTQYVKAGRMTIYTKNSRLAVYEAIYQAALQAKSTGTTLEDQLKILPQ